MVGPTVERIQAEAPAWPLPARKTVPWKAGRPVVLLIDDDDVQRAMLRRMLEQRRPKIRVEEAADRPTAMMRLHALTRKGSPVLVLCDLHLADGDGRSFLVSARRSLPDAEMALFLLSASSFGVERERLGDAGIDGFLEKPMELAAYEAALDEILAAWQTAYSNLHV